MKIIKNSLVYKSMSGFVDMLIEKKADIYMFHNLVSVEDRIKALTCRKVCLESSNVKKKVTLLMEIQVETNEINLDCGRLYLKGRILSQHEHVKKGSYHTIEVELNSRVRIEKSEWTKFELEMLKKMQHSSLEMLFVILRDKKTDIMSLSHGFINKTRSFLVKNKNYKSVCDYLQDNVRNTRRIILVMFKDENKTFIKQLGSLKEKYSGRFCNVLVDLDMKSLSEKQIVKAILTNQRYLDAFREASLKEEIRQIETFKENFSKRPGMICVGVEEIQEAIDYGSIECMMITYEKYRIMSKDDKQKIEGMLKQIKTLGGNTQIIPEIHVIGNYLKDLGGIVANLKFSHKQVS